MALAGIVTGQSVGVLDDEVGLAAVGLLSADDPRYLKVVEHGDATEGRGARDLGDLRAGELLPVHDAHVAGPSLQAHVRAAESQQQQCQEQQRADHQYDVQPAEYRRDRWPAKHIYIPLLLRDYAYETAD